MTEPKKIQIFKCLIASLKEIKKRNHYFTNAGMNVFFNRRWVDCRADISHPFLALFALEENLIEKKGSVCKCDISAHVEAYLCLKDEFDIYELISDIKKVLLKSYDGFAISYHGYEINLPEEGAKMTSLQVKFKLVYLESIS